ncbi:hypothetical protein RclHR1_17060003 [Rhizophagus clarus]|uniref:Transposase domain-containing protein n=1 Tax=Rhizophagus clarus TaxID=94130 RepID=A0A2Z6QWN2_9GLOM|nr:hypothetical protein RclHR1_17060003 [Rhizophagus clarus]
MRTKRKPCEAELIEQVPIVKGYKRRSKLLFPLPDLKTQIASLYQRPDFEKQLVKWTNWHANSGMMTDVYDGEIWKNFSSQIDNSESQFFTKETADSNLGIMINLDWFQLFDSTPYSCGAIYGVICNLPRNVRFNKENILTLGLLPGPSEVKLDKINNYLTPIINELLDFWNEVKLPTKKCPNGKKIRLAVICCSNDIPAARKLCGHISALVGCHRCYKIATSKEEGQRLNFRSFDDMENWFTTRDVKEHKRNAAIWKQQNTEEDRRRHVSETYVRWSEMLRLPYHDPIRHLVVDPMHNLFLGIAQWIIKKLWIEGNKISKSDLEIMERRAKGIKIPTNLGRAPYKIITDQKILGNFVRACSLLVCRIIDNNMITEAHERLLKVALLIEEHYGPEKIIPNLHLCLHIRECCQDYGPLYSFWCFSFERMNGVLGFFPNSHRQIEPELLQIIMQNWRLDNILSSQLNNEKLTEGLKLLKPRSTTGTLSAYDELDYNELFRFRQIFCQETDNTINGSEAFPGKMLIPRKNRVSLPDDIYQILIEYYSNAYESKFISIAESASASLNDIVVTNMFNQFGRVQISAEVFGSVMAPRFFKNAYILAKFIQDNKTSDLFPGQIQYYIEHTTNTPNSLKTHRLALIRWYKLALNRQTQFYTSRRMFKY